MSFAANELIPDLHNTRAEEMWSHIEKSVDFANKTVLDVGCGYADFMVRAWQAGARAVFGIDNSSIVLSDARIRTLPLVREGAGIFFMQKDAEHWSDRWPGYHDIVICTSVLPYMLDPNKLLKNIQRDSGIAIIECQYAGDGPGFDNISNDEDMRKWLSKFEWSSVDKIGSSVLKSRNRTRSIWRCINEG
jgi:SAM-dependent methyltransferase